MSKLNPFFFIPFLMVLALVFGVPGGVDAKAWPGCPPSDSTHNQGPGIRVHFEFLSGGQDIMVSGACGNITLDPPETISDIEWQELDVGNDDLDRADLIGNVFEISNTAGGLWGLILACFKLEVGEVGAVCLKIVSVSQLTNNGDGSYSADMILVRVVI